MSYRFTNQEIAELLRNVAVAYTLKDEKKHRFQIIAYNNASEAISHSTIELQDMFREQNLEKLPGVGTSIRGYIEELFNTGHVQHFDSVINEIPSAVFPLLDIPSFGAKKAFKIVDAFNLKSPDTVLEDIEKIAQQGRIAELPGFGKKSEEDILRAISEFRSGTTKSGRMVLPYAYELAEKVVDHMKKCSEAIEIQPLGSLRRMNSTIGDVDIAVTTHDTEAVLEHFVRYPGTERIIERGPTTAALLVSGGKHVDILVLPPEYFGSLLQHFTGSKFHNVSLREYALKMGYSLSERGIKNLKNDEMTTFSDEAKFYNYLDLDWIPPEIREDQGEISLAKKRKLPKLIKINDIKGDLHIHSNYPIQPSHDMGSDSMADHIRRARELGYEYIGFSEHNPRVTNHTSEQIYTILKKRKKHIEHIYESNKSVRVYNLLEVDITPDGNLALDDSALSYTDAVIVSIHSSFSMDKKRMTDRILKALSHPKAKILAHPTGRLINRRQGYEIEWDRLFDFAAHNDKALEINSWPTRLDLPDVMVKQAKESGVKFVINTDSHALEHMNNMFYGVAVARRGWCELKDIINAQPLKVFEKWLLQ